MLELSQSHVALIQELAARLLDSRKPKTETSTLARDLLAGFYELCVRWGLDGLLEQLAQAHPPLDISDPYALSDHPTLLPALVSQLDTADLDGGGPRNAKPRMVADAVVAALGLTLVDAADPALALDDSVRAEVAATIAAVVDPALAVPAFRDAVIAETRARCEDRHLVAFDKLAAQLDERGSRLVKQPKVPLDASQAVQRLLTETRNAIVERVVRAALDRAQQVIARVSPEAAARIDQPITLRLTPRDVAIVRANDPRVPKVPAAIVASVVESVTQLARIAWRAPEKPVRTYGASQTFAAGDLIEHPKFGRGTVLSTQAARIEVEFPDGKHTLVHKPK